MAGGGAESCVGAGDAALRDGGRELKPLFWVHERGNSGRGRRRLGRRRPGARPVEVLEAPVLGREVGGGAAVGVGAVILAGWGGFPVWHGGAV